MLIQTSVLFPLIENPLASPLGQAHPLVKNKTLSLVVWMVSEDTSYNKVFPVKAANLISKQK